MSKLIEAMVADALDEADQHPQIYIQYSEAERLARRFLRALKEHGPSERIIEAGRWAYAHGSLHVFTSMLTAAIDEADHAEG